MSLTPGTRLGQYEVIASVGAGGMGEVFRARDMKLHRDVALKILPDSFAEDPDRLARFEREAQVLASLNHQHIAAIYGLEESGSHKALVLELVEGPTLADRLQAGPVPIDELRSVARQIADALEAAHAQSIIHRDLKPANIKIRPDGTVKVLDFGLAKALDPVAPNSDSSSSPTITAQATQMGMILGTAAYMAPEQAKGKPVDRRADIWAFGCVVYEMLTGRTAFMGEDVSDTLAFVLTKDPDWSALHPDAPASIQRLLRRCLEKDPKRRLADIADARLELEDDLPAGPPRSTERIRSGWWRGAPWIVAAGAAIALALALVLWAPWRSQPARAAVRLSTHVGADASISAVGGGPSVVVSPNADVIVFSARKTDTSRPSLWVRRLDQLAAVELAGTEGAVGPFLSPDGNWIGFFSTDSRLKKIALTGGAIATLANAPNPRGAHWAEDNTIVFAPDRADTPIVRLAAAGGTPERVTALGSNEATHRQPHVLPGGKALLYTAHSSTSGFDVANIMVKPLPDGQPRVVVRGGYQGRYVRSGHLVFMREGALYAVAFDTDRLQTTGEPAPVVEGISASTLTGGAQVDVAADGTLVYVSGQEAAPGGPLLWLNKEGATNPLHAAPVITLSIQFAPDGRRLALDRYDGRQWDVWTYDWSRDTMSPVTDDPSNEQRPVWAADGARIVFASRRAEGDRVTYNLYSRRTDGTGSVQRLTQNSNQQNPGSWHPSGKWIAFAELNPQTSWDLMILPMDGDEATGWKPGTPSVFLNSRFTELEPIFSPDGRFLAYQSDESGQHEIYVRPFPGPGAREQVSSGGGTHPVWSRSRPELLYLANGKVMAASYATKEEAFRPDKPRLWSPAQISPRTGPVNRSIDLHPDGQRLAFATVANSDPAVKRDHVILIFNFAEELRRRVPTRK